MIKNIIFDLGGVVIDLDRDRAVRQLENLGLTNVSHLLGEYEQKGDFLALEKGEKSSAELYDAILSLCPSDVTATRIRDAFEAFLVALPPERLKAIRALREMGFHTYVLSNTNPIMYNHWIENAFRQEGLTINDYFDGITVSFQERLCKPDPRIFLNVVKRYHLNPAETLMLDDSAANCESARSIGLQAIRVMKNGVDSFSEICKRLMEEASKQ